MAYYANKVKREIAEGKAAPFTYHGRVVYESHQGSQPMSVVFGLRVDGLSAGGACGRWFAGRGRGRVPRHLNKGRGRNAEPFAERAHLANVELALTRQDFGHQALTADVGQVALPKPMLLHHEFQSLHTRDFGQRVLLGFIVRDQIAHDVDQAHRGMIFCALGFVQQGFEEASQLRNRSQQD